MGACSMNERGKFYHALRGFVNKIAFVHGAAFHPSGRAWGGLDRFMRGSQGKKYIFQGRFAGLERENLDGQRL